MCQVVHAKHASSPSTTCTNSCQRSFCDALHPSTFCDAGVHSIIYFFGVKQAVGRHLRRHTLHPSSGLDLDAYYLVVSLAQHSTVLFCSPAETIRPLLPAWTCPRVRVLPPSDVANRVKIHERGCGAQIVTLYGSIKLTHPFVWCSAGANLLWVSHGKPCCAP
jgi:hypothetical protein